MSTTAHVRESADEQQRAAVVALEDDVIELFVELAGLLGLPRSYGEIFGLLYASVRPLSFTEIHERLELSKGSVSQGLKALRQVGAIRPADGQDPRREHYVAETELRSLAAGFLNGSVMPQLRHGATRLDAMKVRHRLFLDASDERAQLLSDRLGKLDVWHRKGAGLLPLITKFLG